MSRRVPYFDGLRALAVLSVVAFHASKYSRTDLARVFPRAVMQLHHGVELFFVISGLCLSYPILVALHEHGSSRFNLVDFAAKRLTRILPPFYCAIALFAVAGSQRVPFVDVIRQALFIDGGTKLLNSSFWSLAVEFRWYALFPLLVLLWIRSQRTFLCLIPALFALQETRAVSTDLVALPAFMLGIVAADLALWRREAAKFALPLFCIVCLAAFLHSSPLDSGQESSALWELSVFLLVVAAGATAWLRRVLSSFPLVFVGAASYSIYLCHELAIQYARAFGWPPVAAGISGVVFGIVFWSVAERPFTSAQGRDRLVRAFSPMLKRVFQFAGIPASVDVASKELTAYAQPNASSTRPAHVGALATHHAIPVLDQ